MDDLRLVAIQKWVRLRLDIHRHFNFWFAPSALLYSVDEDAELPILLEYLAVVAVHFSFAMLLLLLESPYEFRSIIGDQSPLAISHVPSPLSIIPVSFAIEVLTLAMALAMQPLAHIEIAVVEEAPALAFPEVVSPQTVVLVIAPLLLVSTEVNPLPISLVVPYMAFVPITVVIVQNSGLVLLLLTSSEFSWIVLLRTLRCALKVRTMSVWRSRIGPDLMRPW